MQSMNSLEKYIIEKEDKFHYSAMFGFNVGLRKFIDKHMKWLYEEEFRGMVLGVEYILQSIDMYLYLGEITQQDAIELINEIINLNLGSVVVEW